MSRVAKAELTIAEAAALTGKSTDTLYRWIRNGRLTAEDTTDGPIVQTDAVLAAAAKVRPGRPRGE